MELSQLKYFVKLAELLSFTDAAKESFITQSALSISIGRLERELGVRLFDRIGKKVYLTDYGRSFLNYARSSLVTLDDGIAEIGTMLQKIAGAFTIGATYSACGLITPIIAEYNDKFPDLKIKVTLFNTVEDVIKALSDNRIDIALSYRPETLPGTIDCDVVFQSPFSVIVSKSHPWAAKNHVDIEDILGQRIITLPCGTYTRELFDRVVARHGISIHPQVEVNDTGYLLSLVGTGKWIAALASGSIGQSDSYKAIPINGHDETLSICVMWQKWKTLTTVCRTFMQSIRRGIIDAI